VCTVLIERDVKMFQMECERAGFKIVWKSVTSKRSDMSKCASSVNPLVPKLFYDLSSK